MENTTIFSQRLKELRTKKGVTQKELAEKLNISAATIISYEKAQKVPSLDNARAIALYFNVSLDWICGLTDNKSSLKIDKVADIIKVLVEIDLVSRIKIIDIAPYNNNDFVIQFPSKSMSVFISEWVKIKALYESKTIDKNLYDLWIEKQLTEERYQTRLATMEFYKIDETLDDEELPF